MVVLFEGAVLFAIGHDKRKARRKAAERAAVHLDDDVPSTVDPIPAPLSNSGGPSGEWGDTT
jgi:hypothetical protein